MERNKVNGGSFGLEKDPARDVLRRTLKEIERNEGGKKKKNGGKPGTWKNFSVGEGDRKTEEYLGLFSAELQPLLDWVLWDEMEKLSSQVLISDQSLRSQPTAKLLHPDRQTLAG